MNPNGVITDKDEVHWTTLLEHLERQGVELANWLHREIIFELVVPEDFDDDEHRPDVPRLYVDDYYILPVIIGRGRKNNTRRVMGLELRKAATQGSYRTITSGTADLGPSLIRKAVMLAALDEFEDRSPLWSGTRVFYLLARGEDNPDL